MKDAELFALGGVWREWRSADGKTGARTFAIFTVEPDELVTEKTGHGRMPLIVKRTDRPKMLEPGNPEQPPIDLLRPFDSDQMKAWRVGQRINSTRENDSILSEPMKDDEQGGQLGCLENKRDAVKHVKSSRGCGICQLRN